MTDTTVAAGTMDAMAALTPKNQLRRSVRNATVANAIIYPLFIWGGASAYTTANWVAVIGAGVFAVAVFALAWVTVSRLDDEIGWEKMRKKQRLVGAGILSSIFALSAAILWPAISNVTTTLGM